MGTLIWNVLCFGCSQLRYQIHSLLWQQFGGQKWYTMTVGIKAVCGYKINKTWILVNCSLICLTSGQCTIQDKNRRVQWCQQLLLDNRKTAVQPSHPHSGQLVSRPSVIVLSGLVYISHREVNYTPNKNEKSTNQKRHTLFSVPKLNTLLTSIILKVHQSNKIKVI